MATAVDIGTLITEVLDARPRIAGTGISVMRIAGWHQLGCSPGDIARKTGLPLAEIHAALTYYHANRALIDFDLSDEAAEYDRLAGEPR